MAVCVCMRRVLDAGCVSRGVWCHVAVCVCVRRVLNMLGASVVVCGAMWPCVYV